MANISKITVNNTSYDIKDAIALANIEKISTGIKVTKRNGDTFNVPISGGGGTVDTFEVGDSVNLGSFMAYVGNSTTDANVNLIFPKPISDNVKSIKVTIGNLRGNGLNKTATSVTAIIPVDRLRGYITIKSSGLSKYSVMYATNVTVTFNSTAQAINSITDFDLSK